ncbi:MAG: TIR domain-containing protein, partial [Candidatus Zhuqueibacterota bacterium]
MNQVFISYSHKDKDWVRDWLLKKLEEQGVAAHIDYRDFEIGLAAQINMERAIEQCAKTMLVFTPHWLASDWTQFEGIMLQAQDPIGLKKRILPIMLTDCKLPPRLSILTYADFRDQTDWDSQLNRLITQIKKDFGERTPKPTYPALSEKFIKLDHLPKTEFELFGRSAELNLLDDAWQSEAAHVVCFVAYGGVGKSTLVNKWVEKLRWDNFRGAERVYAWSFYSQGTNEQVTSADAFINDALRWFGEKNPEHFRSPWDKGKRLADLVRRQKTLLILDGMEPLQSGFDFEQGKIKDPALGTLVAELSRNNNGLCVITTRENVPELDRCPGSCRQINLEQISDEAGCALLKVRRVQGSEAELQRLSREFGNHALAINLLAEYLRIFPGHAAQPGFAIPDLAIPEEKGRHARRVLEAFVKYFGAGVELELLLLLGLFNRPAPKEALAAIMKQPTIPGLTNAITRCSEGDWLRLLKKLRDFKLIARESKHRPDVIDCHPLIREHFADKLKASSQKRKTKGQQPIAKGQKPNARSETLKAKGETPWRLAHERLYEYYKNLPEKELPDTLEEMEPLFAAVAHGCQAGKHQEVMEKVLFERIYRKDDYYVGHKLGAFGSELSALSNFFEIPWSKIATNLTDADKAVTLSWTGFGLRALGRLREAAQPMKAALENHIKQKNWKECASNAGNLSELYLTLGDVAAAVSSARQSVDFADRSGDVMEKMMDMTGLADAQHQAGELAPAEDWFRQAEAMQLKRQPEYRYLYSLRGFRFCDLLLAQGKVPEVLRRAKQTIEIAIRNNWLLDIALDKLSLGRAYVLEALSSALPTTPPLRAQRSNPLHSGRLLRRSAPRNDRAMQQAADYLNQAVTGLREAG